MRILSQPLLGLRSRFVVRGVVFLLRSSFLIDDVLLVLLSFVRHVVLDVVLGNDCVRLNMNNDGVSSGCSGCTGPWGGSRVAQLSSSSSSVVSRSIRSWWSRRHPLQGFVHQRVVL